MASADRADTEAQIATAVGAADTTALSMLNKRVSELDDYKNEFQVDVFFARDSAVLEEKAKKDLDNLADIAKSLNGYLIEVAGYSSNTLSKEADQKLSEERAAVVAQYLREVKTFHCGAFSCRSATEPPIQQSATRTPMTANSIAT